MAGKQHHDTTQTAWSDPGRHGDALAELPPAPETMAEGCSALIVHFGVASSRGIDVPDKARDDAGLRTIEAMLDRILSRDSSPLTEPRAPQNLLFGSCRQFSLLAAARMRQAGIPARLRVGFADYFRPDHLVDHWVCEYDDGNGWRPLDPELDRTSREQFGIAFPAHDVPRENFRSAAATWQAIRRGQVDPARVGVPEIGAVGTWFAAASLMRDAAALAGVELQPWDYWGCARAFHPGCTLAHDELQRFDALARDLSEEPSTQSDANALMTAHPWVSPGDAVLSFVPFGEPREQPIRSA